MFWLIRKIGYTLLSRHFWLGIGIGFFIASSTFLTVTTTHAASTDLYTQTWYYKNDWLPLHTASTSGAGNSVTVTDSYYSLNVNSTVPATTEQAMIQWINFPWGILTYPINIDYEVINTGAGICTGLLVRGHTTVSGIHNVAASQTRQIIQVAGAAAQNLPQNLGIRFARGSGTCVAEMRIYAVYDSANNVLLGYRPSSSPMYLIDKSSDSSSSSTSATTTVIEAYYGDIAFGLAILIVLEFLMIAGFVYNRLPYGKRD